MVMWPPFLWTCIKAEHHGGEGVAGQITHVATRKQREGEEKAVWGQAITSMCMPTKTHSLQLGATS
jgi:hypothetical protein